MASPVRASERATERVYMYGQGSSVQYCMLRLGEGGELESGRCGGSERCQEMALP